MNTCYKKRDLFSQNHSESLIYLEYEGDKNNSRVPDPEEIGIKLLKGDGDFRSQKCINLLKQADHIILWHKGGKTTAENCQMLGKDDNRTKSGK